MLICAYKLGYVHEWLKKSSCSFHVAPHELFLLSDVNEPKEVWLGLDLIDQLSHSLEVLELHTLNKPLLVISNSGRVRVQYLLATDCSCRNLSFISRGFKNKCGQLCFSEQYHVLALLLFSHWLKLISRSSCSKFLLVLLIIKVSLRMKNFIMLNSFWMSSNDLLLICIKADRKSFRE